MVKLTCPRLGGHVVSALDFSSEVPPHADEAFVGEPSGTTWRPGGSHAKEMRMRVAVILSAATLTISGQSLEKDYLQPDPSDYASWEKANSGEISRKSTARAISGDGTYITYTAFNGVAHTGMSEYRGKHVRLVLNQLWMTTASETQRLQLLDYADRVYADYARIIGREPAGTGLLTIATVPTCGYGCGLVGAKGIEIDPGANWRDDILASLASNGSSFILTHEMAHNFDVFRPFIGYWNDWGHAWTWLNSYLHYYSREGMKGVPADAQFRADRYETYDAYMAASSLNWANCIAGAACDEARKNRVWAGILFRFAELHGHEGMRRFMEFLRKYSVSNPAPTTNEAKEDVRVEAMAYGAGRNIACYVDKWRWTASTALRARMAAQYGTANSNCEDRDGDGFSALDGDPDDTDPAVKPGAADHSEPAGGDFPSGLAVSLPAAIQGSLSTATDADRFTVTLAHRSAVLIELASTGPMQGWLALYHQNGAWRDSRYVAAGSMGSILAELDPGTWTFSVEMNSGSAMGSYRVEAREVPVSGSWASATAESSRLRLTAPRAVRYSEPPDGLEVWLGRYGVIRRMPWDGVSDTTVDVTPSEVPDADRNGVYPFAFRATRQGVPVVDWTDYPVASSWTAPAPGFSIMKPVYGSTLSYTIVQFQWTPSPGALSYEMRLIEANSPQVFRVSLAGDTTSTIYTLESGTYRMELVPCTASGCQPPAVSHFTVRGGSVPPAAPAGMSCTTANDGGQNRLTCRWNTVAGAHFYRVNVVQPGAGPGGGALTVAGGQTGALFASYLVPNGLLSVVVKACTGDGCSPFSPAVQVNPRVGGPNVPVLGEPFAGSVVDSGVHAPRVFFAWNRVAGDTGSNYTYRLFVQDFSRTSPALDVLTVQNFHAAFFNPGTRYDAVVVAIPKSGGPALQGPASAFIVRGRAPNSPVVTEPAYNSTVTRNAQSRVRVTWTPIVNNDGTPATRNYQYYFSGPSDITGVTGTNSVELLLTPGAWRGIVRACMAGTGCSESSNAGWGPWSNAPDSEGGAASFIVR